MGLCWLGFGLAVEVYEGFVRGRGDAVRCAVSVLRFDLLGWLVEYGRTLAELAAGGGIDAVGG